MAYIFLAGAFIFNALGTVLIKLVATDSAPGLLSGIPRLGIFIMSGIALVINFGFYFLALRTLPISVAYPILVGMTFLLSVTAAVWFLGETVTLWHVLGFLFVLAGVVMISVLGAR